MESSSEPVTAKLTKRLTALDPRWLQIATLSSLLIYGISYLSFDTHPAHFIVTTICVQLAFDKLYLKRRFNWKSALITSLSLSLLLRCGSWEIAVLGATLAIASKFIITYNKNHLINPATFAIVVCTLLFDSAWTSSGQWGHVPWFIALFTFAGFVVTRQAHRLDIALWFLTAYIAGLYLRAFFLGNEWAIPFHQLNNGALIVFSFFMITDPKTTPNQKWLRIGFAVATALLTLWMQFGLHIRQALFPALFINCVVINGITQYYLKRGTLKFESFQWPSRLTNKHQ